MKKALICLLFLTGCNEAPKTSMCSKDCPPAIPSTPVGCIFQHDNNNIVTVVNGGPKCAEWGIKVGAKAF